MSESNAKITSGFPAGLRVLAVDDDAVVLRTLERLLLKCGYRVTVAHHALDALKLLRGNKDEYDLVISDVNMPDMDGFKLLEIVGLEMDLPVIMLSVDCDVNSVMKGIMHGAVDYLVKPVRMEELKLIWKHVARRSLDERNNSNNHSGRSDDAHNPQIDKKSKNRRKERDGDDSDYDSDEDTAAQKKPRIIWTAELHAKFINAVNHLGLDRAVPKKILDIMNITGLTRENVASHLQKYRKGFKRNGVGVNHNLNKIAGSGAYNGSLLFMNVNKQFEAICSSERANADEYKHTTRISSCLPAQQYLNGNSLVLSTWFPHPQNHNSSLCRQYSMNPQTNQLRNQHWGLGTNIYPVKSSIETYNYHSLASQSPLKFQGVSDMNSVHKLEFDLDHQNYDLFFNSNPLDKPFSNDLEEILTSEQEQNHFGSCTTFDVEMEAEINRGSFDDQITNPVDAVLTEKVFALNKSEYADDLHAALEQFKR